MSGEGSRGQRDPKDSDQVVHLNSEPLQRCDSMSWRKDGDRCCWIHQKQTCPAWRTRETPGSLPLRVRSPRKVFPLHSIWPRPRVLGRPLLPCEILEISSESLCFNTPSSARRCYRLRMSRRFSWQTSDFFFFNFFMELGEGGPSRVISAHFPPVCSLANECRVPWVSGTPRRTFKSPWWGRALP